MKNLSGKLRVYMSIPLSLGREGTYYLGGNPGNLPPVCWGIFFEVEILTVRIVNTIQDLLESGS